MRRETPHFDRVVVSGRDNNDWEAGRRRNSR
jgi:hypothetical protein